MKLSVSNSSKKDLEKVARISLFAFILLCIISLTIFQDYIYSRLRHTAFYFSESLTYNIFWAFFVPLGFLVILLLKFYIPKTRFAQSLYLLGIGAIFSFLHILVFTAFFILISNIFFTPPHRFIAIFKSAISNHLYIAFLFYTIAPFFYLKFLQKGQIKSEMITQYSDKINLKIGASIKTVAISSIQLIATDKPYTIVYSGDEKYLQDKSLKEFEKELEPTFFMRVHRSAIVNKEYIKEMISRKNGDYDVILENGSEIRFSRHYRKNWKSILH